MPKSNYELILAIVNSGMADDVMDVARECGVRGGTILTARGVTNEEAAATVEAELAELLEDYN